MYNVVLFLHSWVRWGVLILAVLVIIRAIQGRNRHAAWTASDERGLTLYTRVLGVQFLLGLLLYVALSPATAEAFRDFGFAMRTPSLRYWAVEHLAGMIVAMGLSEVGRARVRKTADAQGKHSRALIFTALALLVMLLSIPWPGLPNGRELFRF